MTSENCHARAALAPMCLRALRWLEPLPAPAEKDNAGAGVDLSYDLAYDLDYERLRAEVAKADSPASGQVDWSRVLLHVDAVLCQKHKDLLAAAYGVHGLHQTEGLSGLSDGLIFLASFIDAYWDGTSTTTSRIRRRVNAVQWLLDRTCPVVLDVAADAVHRATVERLLAATSQFAEAVAARFGRDAPAVRPLRDAVNRLALSVPEDNSDSDNSDAASSDAAQGSTSTEGGSAQSIDAAEAHRIPMSQRADEPHHAPAPVPAMRAVEVRMPDVVEAAARRTTASEEPRDQLRSLSLGIIETAQLMRQHRPTDAAAYRLLRVGLWLPITEAPVLGPEGRSKIPALPETLRAKLDSLLGEGKWTELLTESESATLRHRLCLDLQHYSVMALAGLGDSYTSARRAVVTEVLSLVQRLPVIAGLLAVDGSPLCCKPAQTWLASEINAGESSELQTTKQAAGTPLLSQTSDRAPRDTAETLESAQRAVAQSSTGRARFAAQLELAGILRRNRRVSLARALYAALDREVVARELQSWEPELTTKCLAGHLLCLQSLETTNEGVETRACSDTGELMSRLLQLDAVEALSIADTLAL